MKITLAMENAKNEVRESIENIRVKYGIPACLAEGILQEIISEIKTESTAQLIKEMNEIIENKNKELEKAKAAAKKVLKTEPEEQQEQEEQKENSEK